MEAVIDSCLSQLRRDNPYYRDFVINRTSEYLRRVSKSGEAVPFDGDMRELIFKVSTAMHGYCSGYVTGIDHRYQENDVELSEELDKLPAWMALKAAARKFDLDDCVLPRVGFWLTQFMSGQDDDILLFLSGYSNMCGMQDGINDINSGYIAEQMLREPYASEHAGSVRSVDSAIESEILVHMESFMNFDTHTMLFCARAGSMDVTDDITQHKRDVLSAYLSAVESKAKVFLNREISCPSGFDERSERYVAERARFLVGEALNGFVPACCGFIDASDFDIEIGVKLDAATGSNFLPTIFMNCLFLGIDYKYLGDIVAIVTSRFGHCISEGRIPYPEIAAFEQIAVGRGIALEVVDTLNMRLDDEQLDLFEKLAEADKV